MIGIFDIVISYVNEITQNSGGTLMAKESGVKELQSECDILDEIFCDNGGMSVSVDICESGDIEISMVLACFSANKYNQSYFDLIDRCSSFSVCNTDTNDLKITFILGVAVFEYNAV